LEKVDLRSASASQAVQHGTSCHPTMLSCVPRENCVNVWGRMMMLDPPHVAQAGEVSRIHVTPQLPQLIWMPAPDVSPLRFAVSPQLAHVKVGLIVTNSTVTSR